MGDGGAYVETRWAVSVLGVVVALIEWNGVDVLANLPLNAVLVKLTGVRANLAIGDAI